jgi:CarD family transcriptional regulator
MKVTAGTAAKARGAANTYRAASGRTTGQPSAKAASTAQAKKTEAPAKAQGVVAAKAAAPPTVKAATAAKPAAATPAPVRAAPAEPEPKPTTAAPAVHHEVARPTVTRETAPVAAAPAAAPAVDRRPMMPDRPPPRLPAKPETFAEGDHVVYPTHGVGKVERIAIEEIAGHKLELIHITFEENRMTLRVPVAKARTAGLRKLATRKMFDEALAVLKGRARIKRTMWSRRAQEYEAKINSGDPLAIAEVVRDLHRNAGQPDQSFSERQIYEAAMDRLAAELAALDKTDKATAVGKLADFLKTV